MIHGRLVAFFASRPDILSDHIHSQYKVAHKAVCRLCKGRQIKRAIWDLDMLRKADIALWMRISGGRHVSSLLPSKLPLKQLLCSIGGSKETRTTTTTNYDEREWFLHLLSRLQLAQPSASYLLALSLARHSRLAPFYLDVIHPVARTVSTPDSQRCLLRLTEASQNRAPP